MQILQPTAAACAAVALLLGVGALRAARAMRALYPPPLSAPAGDETPPAHDPELPTAVVLLDHAGTEVSDFLLPYELLAASAAFNVHALAPEYRPAPLTGGLDVMPHLSLAGFEQLPLDAADLIVVPHLPDPDPRLVDWLHLQAQLGATVLSICTGAGVVAAAGLLDGRSATTHWGDIGGLERRYPQVNWTRGVRYVDDGELVSSAGITSGIDATLHVIRRLTDPKTMHRAAAALGYTDLSYLQDPTVDQHRLEPADLILPLTAAFAPRHRLGVRLEEGVSETAVAAVMDTFTATFSARASTMTSNGLPVVSRHGLVLLPRHSIHDAPALDRVLQPTCPDPGAGRGATAGPAPTAVQPVTDRPYAAFEDALGQLAAIEGRPIARFAARRLEHRTAPPIQARGWGQVMLRLIASPVVGPARASRRAIRQAVGAAVRRPRA